MQSVVYTTQEKNIKNLYGALHHVPLLLTIPELSTITIQGKLTSVCFLESELICDLIIPEDDHIAYISCNYGEIYNPKCPAFKEKREAAKKAKKPVKKKCRRRVQGRGTSLSSQITFTICSDNKSKYYQVHLFRNGAFTVPGVVNIDIRELFDIIPRLIAYLKSNKIFSENDIRMESYKSIMTNYKARLFCTDYHINLEELELIIKQFKQVDINNTRELGQDNMIDTFYDKIINYMKDFPKTNGCIDAQVIAALIGPDDCARLNLDSHDEIKTESNAMGISIVRRNIEKGSNLVMKSIKDSSTNREITLKILKKGKINFDGANTKFDILESFLWIQYIYYTNFNRILCNIKLIRNATPDTSDCDEKSIYDSEPNDLSPNRFLERTAEKKTKRKPVIDFTQDVDYTSTREIISRVLKARKERVKALKANPFE